MPELPEVQNITSQLQILVGQSLVGFTIDNEPRCEGDISIFQNKSIQSVRRIAKNCILDFQNGSMIFFFALTGNLRIMPSSQKMEWGKYDRLSLSFDQYILVFSDLRGFGRVVNTQDAEAYLNYQGLEPLGHHFSPSYLSTKLAKTKRPIKVAIMDNKIVLGIGNLYASEILWNCKIHPLRAANSLTAQEIERLFQSIKAILQFAIEQGGASFSDFRHTDGDIGKFQNFLVAYQQSLCKRCGLKITKLNIQGRGSYFCQKCQT